MWKQAAEGWAWVGGFHTLGECVTQLFDYEFSEKKVGLLPKRSQVRHKLESVAVRLDAILGRYQANQ